MATKSRTTTAPVKPPKAPAPVEATTKPRGFHLDRRAELLLAVAHYRNDGSGGEADDDELLNTRQVADMLQVSPQWCVLGRSQGYGPKFIKVSTRRVAYRRSAVRAWLEERTYSRTSEYTKTREAV